MKGLDLRKFKKIKVEDDHTILAHPSGHEIKISHKLISKDLKAQLNKLPSYADGGTVEEKDKKPSPPPSSPLPSDDARKTTQDAMRKAFKFANGGDVIQGEAQPVMASKLESQYMPEEATAQQMSTPMPQSDPRADIAAALKNMSVHYASHPQQPTPSPQDSAVPTPAPAPTPGPIAVGEQQPMPQAQPLSPEMQPQVSGTQSAPMGANLTQQAQQAVGQQNQAESQMAGNTQQAMQQKSDIYGQQVQDMQKLHAHYEDIGNQLHHKFDTLSQEVSQGKIDPSHWWNEKSTGSKILTAIGMLFAGAGSGASGHPEMVGNAINKILERDIDAQKSDLSNKQSLLGKYMDMYKSLPEAEAAARMTMGAAVEGMLNQQAAKLGSQNASLMAQQLNAQRRQQLLPTLEGLAKGQMMLGLYGDMSKPQQQPGNDEQNYQNQMSRMRMINPDLGKDMENKYLPNVGAARIPVPEKIRDELTSRKDLSDKLAQLELFAKKNQGTTLDRSIVNQGKALAAQVQDAYRRANQQGVFKESESKFVNSVIDADPTSFMADARTLPGYREARKINDGTINQYYKSYGIKPFKSEGSEQSGSVSREAAIAEAKRRGLIK